MYELVSEFAGTHLYQEWEDEFPTLEDAVGHFVETLEPAERRQFIEELTALAEIGAGNEEKLLAILSDLDFDITDPDGRTDELLRDIARMAHP